MKKKEISDNLMYFQQYIGKEKIKKQLRQAGYTGEGKFDDFDEVYMSIRSELPESLKSDSKFITCEALALGVDQGKITESELDEVLFRVLEDSLLNSYLYKIESHDIVLTDSGSIPGVLKNWSVSLKKSIVGNISRDAKGLDFVTCSYRLYETDGQVEAIRLLLLDKELVPLGGKNKEEVMVAYPTLIDFDFRRNLVHIRLKDVNNLETDIEEVGTMSKRIERTQKFISSLSPEIRTSSISKFGKYLYKIEEDILSEKRKLAEDKLQSFDKIIESFVEEIAAGLEAQVNGSISARQYISYAVLSTIAATLPNNEQGDVVGIKFRSTREEGTKEFAEVHISDKGYKCISTHNPYWLNLPILQGEQKVESMKLIKKLSDGYRIAKFEFSLETANVRLLQKNEHPDKDYHRQPTDADYSEMIEYLVGFMD
ncbi:hypothetical protein A8L34_10700 [Bacillus sp. FJAT-27264]|uniref:hypothetical protein n=1 Tax=Paenibacillus sp. (strain DSM 101736 / FJAT-27264) TaxID=1850362 RepID=UPI0008081393|nr:hypothetical protein [Bacillus sp. FJAT-27264]OBZ14402.1 hypothetical protein A8L34_10700 [Bacillus sp. FJAT-27264]